MRDRRRGGCGLAEEDAEARGPCSAAVPGVRRRSLDNRGKRVSGAGVGSCRVSSDRTSAARGHLDAQSVGEIDLAPARGKLGAVALGHGVELGAEAVSSSRGQEGGAVVVPLASMDGEHVALEVDVLHAEGEAFEEAKAATVEDFRDEPERRLQVLGDRALVAAREDRREVLGAVSAFEARERRRVEVEDLAVEEDEGAEGLVLGGRRDAARGGEVVEEGGDLGGAEGAGVAAVVEGDVGADPVEVGFLGAQGVLEAAEGAVDGFDEGHGKGRSARLGRELRGGGIYLGVRSSIASFALAPVLRP
jgi:hypothetical protein